MTRTGERRTVAPTISTTVNMPRGMLMMAMGAERSH